MTNLLLWDGNEFTSVEIGEGIDDYYKYLECSTFDIATRNVGGKYFDIFCDDEGLFKENPKITAMSPTGRVMFVGNLIFANHDAEGNTTSLTKEDVDRIMQNKFTVFDMNNGAMFDVVMCDW